MFVNSTKKKKNASNCIRGPNIGLFTARLAQLVSVSDWQAGVPGFESSAGGKLKWPYFFVHLNNNNTDANTRFTSNEFKLKARRSIPT